MYHDDHDVMICMIIQAALSTTGSSLLRTESCHNRINVNQ
jgi:hypothetical protein